MNQLKTTFFTITWLVFSYLILCAAIAATYEEMIIHETSTTQPFWGDYYKNIKWLQHTPDQTAASFEGEAGSGGQVDIGRIKLYSAGKVGFIKVIWGQGVTEHSLEIEVYKDSGMKQLISRIEPRGIQPNFAVEDLDGDGNLEIAVWGAVSDPNMSQLSEDKSKPFEGHSDPHLFEVAIYKLEGKELILQKQYVTKQKYEPFCKEMPKD